MREKTFRFKQLRIIESQHLKPFSIYMEVKIRMSLEFCRNDARGRKDQLPLSGLCKTLTTYDVSLESSSIIFLDYMTSDCIID